MKTFDAENIVLGRLSSKIAKLLLNGEEVAVVNADKAVLSGDPSVTVSKYHNRRLQKDKSNPEHSAHWPRRPDLMAKRIMRGMLPFKSARGRAAYKRLRVYMGVPPELAGAKFEKIDMKTKDALQSRYISIADLCQRLGYNE